MYAREMSHNTKSAKLFLKIFGVSLKLHYLCTVV